MPSLKNCRACDISSESRTFKGGGSTTSAEGASFLGRSWPARPTPPLDQPGSGEMLLLKILKIQLPGTAISCVFSDQMWRQMRARAVKLWPRFTFR